MFYWNDEENSDGVKHRLGAWVGKFPGIWEPVPSDFQVLNPWLPFHPHLQGPAGKSVLKNEGFTASDLNLKVTRCLAYFAA